MVPGIEKEGAQYVETWTWGNGRSKVGCLNKPSRMPPSRAAVQGGIPRFPEKLQKPRRLVDLIEDLARQRSFDPDQGRWSFLPRREAPQGERFRGRDGRRRRAVSYPSCLCRAIVWTEKS